MLFSKKSYNSFFLVFILFILFPFLAFAQKNTAQKGVLVWSDASQSISLEGEWAFYWQSFTSPAHQVSSKPPNYVQVPNNWVVYKHLNPTPTYFGYATYELKIIIPKALKNKRLAIKIPIIPSAYQCFIDGKLVAEVGKIGTEATHYQPFLETKIVTFQAISDTVQLTMQVSNFNDLSGGINKPILLGEEEKIETLQFGSHFFDIFLLGSLFIMGLYHLALYLLVRENKAALFFGIFCLIVALRTFAVGEMYITYVFDFFPYLYEIEGKLSFLTYSIGLLIFALFFEALFPLDFHKVVLPTMKVVCLAETTLIIIAPFHIYIFSLPYFQIFTLLFIVYSLYVFGQIIHKKRREGVLFIAGSLALIFATVNDILHVNGVINTAHTIHFGLFVFIFAQTFILAIRFSNAFKKVAKFNTVLEQKVDARTQELSLLNEELNQSNEELNTALDLLAEQKKAQEVTYNNLLDAITYAKRIQEAILPSKTQMKEILGKYFVLYLPRDIVSGDFYYVASKEHKKVIIVADCTGHGVPGALMSMIAHEILNDIIKSRSITAPSLILEELHKRIREVLHQKDNSNNDGLDVSVLTIDTITKEITFAGARQSLVYMQAGEAKIIRGNNYPIGGEQREKTRFFDLYTLPNHSISHLYLFTDGFQDQFGGENGKKFMLSNFIKTINEIHNLPIETQKKQLHKILNQWIEEANETQIDDILVLGVELT